MLCAAALAVFPPQAEACTRAVYLGPDGMTVTGRTMDWREDPLTNLYIFPRGVVRRGANTDKTVFWTSKYGSLSAAGYDIGITDGMNEAGLVANLLFLPESVYERPGDTRPVMGLSVWTQYVLDNFATVDEAVAELSKEKFRIDAPDLPNGVQSRLHLAISDPSGDSAIFEYRDGKLEIHHGRQCQVMTNSPFYDDQLAILGYWRQIGGLTMLPGTNRASDRFVRASFYIDAVVQTSDPKIAVPAVMSVMRNVSVPYGISPRRAGARSATRRTGSTISNRRWPWRPFGSTWRRSTFRRAAASASSRLPAGRPMRATPRRNYGNRPSPSSFFSEFRGNVKCAISASLKQLHDIYVSKLNNCEL